MSLFALSVFESTYKKSSRGHQEGTFQLLKAAKLKEIARRASKFVLVFLKMVLAGGLENGRLQKLSIDPRKPLKPRAEIRGWAQKRQNFTPAAHFKKCRLLEMQHSGHF